MKSIIRKTMQYSCPVIIIFASFISNIAAADVNDAKLKVLSEFMGEEGFPEALKVAVLASCREIRWQVLRSRIPKNIWAESSFGYCGQKYHEGLFLK